jgi:glycerophosphoryl diester phosphodiesterase
VHHDPTLERTTNGRGAVRLKTAAELAAVDAGHRFGGERDEFPFRAKGIAIPTLREVLARFQVPLIIELKTPEPALARATIDEVRAVNALGRVSLGSFYAKALNAARGYEPGIATGAAREETRLALYKSWVHWPLGRPSFREFQVPERSGRTTIVTPRFVAHAHRAGLPVKVWTVNARPDIERLLSWGVDGIISDRPEIAVDAVRTMAR